jgi:light-regulated signal transduction histidine kinase (bacteriophytochrome)
MNSGHWRLQLVRMETLQLDATARMGVRDYGTGVRPADQKRIIKLFGRGMAGATVGGLGWGLRLVKKVAHLHAATVSVPAEGATSFARSGERTVMTSATDGHLSNETAPDFTLPGGGRQASRAP